MTARVTLSCDGLFDAGRMPCRGAISYAVDRVADTAGMIGTDLVDVVVARELAAAVGWSGDDAGDWCPSHTRLRAVRLLEQLAVHAPLLTREQAIAALGPYLTGGQLGQLEAVKLDPRRLP